MADTKDLKSFAEKHEGSTPSPGTFKIVHDNSFFRYEKQEPTDEEKKAFVRALLRSAITAKLKEDERRWEKEFNGHRKDKESNKTSE